MLQLLNSVKNKSIKALNATHQKQSQKKKRQQLMWQGYKKGFKAYLQLEKSLSDNSVEAYLHDVEKLTSWMLQSGLQKTPAQVELKDLEAFVRWVGELGMTATSQARMISGLKSFFKYCLLEEIVSLDPATLLEAPKLKRSLPDVLSFEEIEAIIQQIDL